PLRQRPGLGTLCNALLVGLSMDATLALLPEVDHLAVRSGLLVAGVVLNGVATGLYIGAGLGPGPRDGLMTGLAARGLSIRLARTAIELSVLALGFVLGGTVGVGTVLYAVTIGPLAHYFIPRLTYHPPAVPQPRQACVTARTRSAPATGGAPLPAPTPPPHRCHRPRRRSRRRLRAGSRERPAPLRRPAAAARRPPAARGRTRPGRRRAPPPAPAASPTAAPPPPPGPAAAPRRRPPDRAGRGRTRAPPVR